MAVRLLRASSDQRPAEREGGEAGFVARLSNYQRPAILILLRERESHGYELVQRMMDLGLEPPVAAGVYAVLRSMEAEGLVSSSWDTSRSGGPPRRVYATTAAGEVFLQEIEPLLSRQRAALEAMLDRYRDPGPSPNS